LIQIINNWFFNLVDAYMHYKYGRRKVPLFKGHPTVIIEIGGGYGANFRYLKKGTKVKVIEPNNGFFDVLRYRANRYEINLEIYETGGEEMPFPENSHEMVMSSLVLCSVQNPAQVLSEIKRVLKPEGKFVYLEHVKADEHSWICKVQELTKTPWKWFFDGCHVNRNTGKAIKDADFSTVQQNQFSHKTIFIPIIPHIEGIATK